jgi:hypothetical protein
VENPVLCAPQIRSLSPNILLQTLQNFAVKLCVEGLALGDEFAMKNVVDVEKHDKHGLHLATDFVPSFVVGSSIATTAALSECPTRRPKTHHR